MGEHGDGGSEGDSDGGSWLSLIFNTSTIYVFASFSSTSAFPPHPLAPPLSPPTSVASLSRPPSNSTYFSFVSSFSTSPAATSSYFTTYSSPGASCSATSSVASFAIVCSIHHLLIWFIFVSASGNSFSLASVSSSSLYRLLHLLHVAL